MYALVKKRRRRRFPGNPGTLRQDNEKIERKVENDEPSMKYC